MNAYPSRKKKTAFVLLALLINLLILLTLFYPQEIKRRLQLVLPEKDYKQMMRRQERLGALKPRASNFGAPVIFQNAPASQPAQQTQATKEEVQKMHDKPAKPAEKTQEEQKQPTFLDTIIKEAQKKEKTIWNNPSIHPKGTQGERRIEKPQEKKVAAPPKQILTHKKKPVQQKPATKKQLTLADITRGFIHNIKNEGNNTIKMDGDPNKAPTDEQLKHERYIQRLVWCLQNSLRIHHKRIRGVRDAKDPEVFIALSAQGKLEDVRIVKTSTNRELDLFMLFVFKDASSAFPPVPAYLNKKGYRITFRVDLGNDTYSRMKYSFQ